MDESLILYYESLSDNDKKVLSIAVLMGKFTLSELFSVVQKFTSISQKANISISEMIKLITGNG